MPNFNLEELTYSILGAAYEVRRHLGMHLFEEMYEQALQTELKLRGINSTRQVQIPVYYKGIRLEKNYRIDLVVENIIPIELKAIPIMGATELTQILSYLEFGNFKFGYLMNFRASDFSISKVPDDLILDKGIYRVIKSR